MKRLVIATTVLAALSASPALAQSYNTDYGTSTSLSAQSSWQAHDTRRARGLNAQAYVPDAYVDGVNVGTDPDPSIRLQLRRDPTSLTQ